MFVYVFKRINMEKKKWVKFRQYHSLIWCLAGLCALTHIVPSIYEQPTGPGHIPHMIICRWYCHVPWNRPIFRTFLKDLKTLVLWEKPASVAQLDAPSDWRPGGRGFNPRRGRQHSFVEIDHEIFSTVILSLPLIQEGQLSVSGKRMCTILVNCLED